MVIQQKLLLCPATGNLKFHLKIFEDTVLSTCFHVHENTVSGLGEMQNRKGVGKEKGVNKEEDLIQRSRTAARNWMKVQ